MGGRHFLALVASGQFTMDLLIRVGADVFAPDSEKIAIYIASGD